MYAEGARFLAGAAFPDAAFLLTAALVLKATFLGAAFPLALPLTSSGAAFSWT
jgi:hypothetical protein